MVIRGPVSVELIDAHTRKPFQEHIGPDGRVYVEVEPDAEYFVAVYNTSCASPTSMTMGCTCIIDGKPLGYYSFLVPVYSPQQPTLELGSWTRQGSIETMTSFRFTKPPHDNHPHYHSNNGYYDDSDSSEVIMGSVTVQIHQAYMGGYVPLYDCQSDIMIPDPIVNMRVTPEKEKKLLRTEQGTYSTMMDQAYITPNGMVPHFYAGPLLDEVTFHYCAAAGLIRAGILCRPPLQDLSRSSSGNVNRRRSGSSSSSGEGSPVDNSKVIYKRFKFEGVARDGTIVKESREHDHFDLTELDE